MDGLRAGEYLVRVSSSAMAGFQLAKFGHFEAEDLAIIGNPIGVNVQEAPEDFDFFEMVDGLLMDDNAVNFDSTALPLPGLPAE